MARRAGPPSAALPVATSAGRIERWLTESFERAGWRGIARRLLLAGTVGVMLWVTAAMIIGGLAGRMSATELLWGVAINDGAAVVGLAVARWVVYRDIATFEAWEEAGRPAAEAPRILRLALTFPIRLATWGIATYVVVAIPTSYTWIIATVESLAFALVLCVGGLLAATIVTWVVVVFVAELGTRPLVAQLCADFPHLSAPEGQGMSLRTRALLPIPAVTMTTGICVVGVAGRLAEPIEQIGAGILLSLVFTVLIALLLRFAVTEAALRPVDDLIEGVKRIATGDLASRVPITSADELAVLGRAVNEMSERLAAHDGDMRASRARIVAASDEARRNVERDLHDGAQQYLVLLQLKLGQARRILETDPHAAGAAIDDASEELAHALAELRDLAHGIYPAVLESDGLPAALAAAADRSSIPVTVDADGVGRYAQELEAAVYFCCLEALQNAAKHAGDGAKVAVRLSQDDGQVEFTIADDGHGYDAATVGPSAGLQNMADRLGAIGGELRIESTPGAGTTVRGAVPIEVTR
jgi:signal transduction histidine kinase